MASTMNENDVTELMRSIEELTNEMRTVQETYESSIQQLNQKFKQIEQCVGKNRNLTKTYYELLNEWEEVKLQVNQTSEKERIKYEGMVEEMKNQLEVIRSKTEVIGSYESKRSQFLILLMGNAPIKLWNESDRVKFKTEYNHFKERTLWFFMLFPVLQVYFHFSILLHQMHTLYLFYYYVSLAIRENILKQNGSRIEHWWIVHHYITLLVSLLFFVNITPNHPAVLTGGIYLVNYFMIWQGFIMAMQMRYQGKRHYVRKVLAKKNTMDVRTTEVIDERPHGDFEFLIPALYATYLFQFVVAVYFAYVFFTQRFTYFYEKAQMGLLSLFWTILPIGNLSTLVKVLYRKRVMHASTNRITHALNKAKQSLNALFGQKKNK